VHGFSPAEIQKLLLGSLQNAWLSPANLLMINIGRSLNPYRPHRTQASKTGTANLEYLRRATLGKPILRAENDEFGLAYVLVPMIVEPGNREVTPAFGRISRRERERCIKLVEVRYDVHLWVKEESYGSFAAAGWLSQTSWC
jgi:hypothetical protein